MTIMRYLLVLPFMLSLAFAGELKIVTITSDFDRLTTTFFIELKEDNTIDAMRIIRTQASGQVEADDSHPAERVITQGAVLYEQRGYEVVRLKLEKFDAKLGGTIVLDYLYNGVTGSRNRMKLKLEPTASGFELMDFHNKKVSKLYIISNRTPLGAVGIREIRIIP